MRAIHFLAFRWAPALALALGAASLEAQQTQSVPVHQTAIIQQQTIMTDDPQTWPAVFDGTRSGGPIRWVDGVAALKADSNLANALYVGTVGPVRVFVCRAKLQD